MYLYNYNNINQQPTSARSSNSQRSMTPPPGALSPKGRDDICTEPCCNNSPAQSKTPPPQELHSNGGKLSARFADSLLQITGICDVCQAGTCSCNPEHTPRMITTSSQTVYSSQDEDEDEVETAVEALARLGYPNAGAATPTNTALFDTKENGYLTPLINKLDDEHTQFTQQGYIEGVYKPFRKSDGFDNKLIQDELITLKLSLDPSSETRKSQKQQKHRSRSKDGRKPKKTRNSHKVKRDDVDVKDLNHDRDFHRSPYQKSAIEILSSRDGYREEHLPWYEDDRAQDDLVDEEIKRTLHRRFNSHHHRGGDHDTLEPSRRSPTPTSARADPPDPVMMFKGCRVTPKQERKKLNSFAEPENKTPTRKSSKTKRNSNSQKKVSSSSRKQVPSSPNLNGTAHLTDIPAYNYKVGLTTSPRSDYSLSSSSSSFNYGHDSLNQPNFSLQGDLRSPRSAFHPYPIDTVLYSAST